MYVTVGVTGTCHAWNDRTYESVGGGAATADGNGAARVAVEVDREGTTPTGSTGTAHDLLRAT